MNVQVGFAHSSIWDLRSIKNVVLPGKENSSLKAELVSFCASMFAFDLWLKLWG